MPRDTPFVYGEFKSRHTAKIMPGKVQGSENPDPARVPAASGA
jgi:hypothetical protein